MAEFRKLKRDRWTLWRWRFLFWLEIALLIIALIVLFAVELRIFPHLSSPELVWRNFALVRLQHVDCSDAAALS